ncbi:MAG: hypothetical protein C5B57_11400 [Blastocatellia bacterium]|nr:MAG: hypothetical protein C5B57_11400 [Blastocatellia bacterium]
MSRFGVIALFGLCVLVGFGCAVLEPRLRRRPAVWQLAIAVIAFVELCPAPLREDRPGGVPMVRVPSTPDAYRYVAAQNGQFSVLELPLFDAPFLWRNAPYVYWSTTHWHPLLNGYSGFAPPSYSSLRRILNRFPDDLSRELLARRGTRFVIVHWSNFGSLDNPPNAEELGRAPWLRLVARFPDGDVFEVQSAGRPGGG